MHTFLGEKGKKEHCVTKYFNCLVMGSETVYQKLNELLKQIIR